MSQEATFPTDAFGTHEAPPASPPPAAPTPDAENSAAGGEASAAEASAAEAVAAIKTLQSRIWPAAGVAIGIGSAAVAAALLYRSRR